MEFDGGEEEGRDDEGPLFAWLPPEDRLWRHPSEMGDISVDPGPGQARSFPRPAARVWSVAIVAGLAGALFASGFFMATGITDRRTTVVEPVVTPSTVALAATSSGSQSDVADWPLIAKSLAASVVAVRVSDRDSDNSQIGSGVLYAAGHGQSYVLTAQDLIAGDRRVSVSFTDGDPQPAHVVGTDPVTGIALLSTAGADRSFPTFGSVSNVEIAEQVLAVGTRLANSDSVVTGAVSGVDQAVTTGPDRTTMIGMLALSGLDVPEQSDGGALVDPAGEVVGIDTDVSSAASVRQGVAYAVPIDVAEHVAQQLLVGTRATHPWLGVDDATDPTVSTVRQLAVAGGAEVGGVETDSPAAAAGLRPYDVITAFDGQAVTSSGALVTLLWECQPGDRATLTFFRQSKKSTVTLTLAGQAQAP